MIDEELLRLKKTRIKFDGTDKSQTLEQLLKRPELTYESIEEVSPSDKTLTSEINKQVEIQVKYDGYIQRQMEMAEKLKKAEADDLC